MIINAIGQSGLFSYGCLYLCIYLWIITQEPEFSQKLNLCRHKTNNTKFYLTPHLRKSNNKIFLKNLITLIFYHFQFLILQLSTKMQK